MLASVQGLLPLYFDLLGVLFHAHLYPEPSILTGESVLPSRAVHDAICVSVAFLVLLTSISY